MSDTFTYFTQSSIEFVVTVPAQYSSEGRGWALIPSIVVIPTVVHYFVSCEVKKLELLDIL